jgi:hypothetical protein
MLVRFARTVFAPPRAVGVWRLSSSLTSHEASLFVDPTAPPLDRRRDQGFRFGVREDELQVRTAPRRRRRRRCCCACRGGVAVMRRDVTCRV